MDLVEASGDDVDQLADWWFALASEMEQYSALNELTHDTSDPAREGFEELLNRDGTTVFLLEVADATVGYLTLREGEHPSRKRSRYAKIVDLFVEAGHRGRGHGSDAVDAVKRIAVARGADYVTVSCEWHNERAREFYGANGFTEKQVTFAQPVDADD